MKNFGRMPILVPQSLEIVLQGLEWNLVYIINFEPGGYCPFLKNNLCSIHEVKPNVCARFPYDEEGNLRIDDFFIKICKGIKKH
ncbi:MAG: hypothetical protein EU539_07905 [Promethearchaeota archaeon]|nr:MAG: hypothetical protein EU539_07905 [Candidatus Lokiarchaeota archaeon]